MTSKDIDRAKILDTSLQRIQERKATLEDCLRANPGAAADLQPLLETAGRVRDILTPASPSAEFQKTSAARLRRRLKAVMDDSRRRSPVPYSPFRGIWIRAAAAVFVLTGVIILVSGWGVTTASAQALPGDALYPVKIGVEEISLAFTWSAAGDVALLADFADERLEEVQELIRKDRAADLVTGLGEYEKTLDRLDSALETLPSDSGSAQLEDILARLARHAGVLLNLRGQMPPPAQTALDRAVGRSLKSKELIENLRHGKSPDDLLPDREKKSTKEPGQGSGKPTFKKTPDPEPGPKQKTKTPKPDTKD